MLWRPFREADLSACLETQPACLGDAIVGRAEALRVWKHLVGEAGFHASVIESGRQIVACGMGVFVSGAFADQEIANPRPGLNSRIIADISGTPLADARGSVTSILSRDRKDAVVERPIVLTREEIGAG